MVFTTEGLFEVAIESWPEWDLNPYIYICIYTCRFIRIYTHFIYTFRAFRVGFKAARVRC